ncbi:MAG: hypothetical protein ACI85O_001076 [Saprospiraceae bacterium]
MDQAVRLHELVAAAEVVEVVYLADVKGRDSGYVSIKQKKAIRLIVLPFFCTFLIHLRKSVKMYKYPPTIKRVLFVLMSLFLILQSHKVCWLNFGFEPSSWQWDILMGFIFNLFVTGIFAFAVFALPVERLLPESYYRIKTPKKLNNFGKRIGIEAFRKFLLATVWKDKNKQKGFFDGTAAGLEGFDVNTKKSDFGHLFPLFLLSIIVIILCFYGKWLMAFTTMIINIIFNFYPVILQRMHRARTARMWAILKRRGER